MSRKLPRITGKDLVKALQRADFRIVRIKGSHYHLYHDEKEVLVTIPVHSGKILAPKTLKCILKAAGISLDELDNLL
ncbi:type II toxin-antitoxin system HicA family toxin [Thermosulfurimonas dismutans]|uniref:Type II toxin-antitoxin system HicA family toxin n=1 Tax=Thermosulfurimonas dismutans TaxID=999894 RepID=A0A179D484_9BACT|nr:type II toxin-antitoxin system HicA family toxin [Thermosulfurimonas dismutans]OAQ20292.1 hypothetical protein TDIS_1647 [Thermosulfurimonas dismutans]